MTMLAYSDLISKLRDVSSVTRNVFGCNNVRVVWMSPTSLLRVCTVLIVLLCIPLVCGVTQAIVWPIVKWLCYLGCGVMCFT
jgi:hypothetical protein